jgi:hypothetical protein
VDRKIVSDGTKTLIAHIGNVEVSRPELITGLFFVGTEDGEAGPGVLTVQFGLHGWEMRNEDGFVQPNTYNPHTDYQHDGLYQAAHWLRNKLESRHEARLAAVK